ncbi:MAG: FKBP-type peptidyl-prolyl cis-trans isomerase [Succinivibrio sp.]|nr:FKBP-type peptidyl-prolyl cis-trans isomerase [Succinivibrio sp.]
MFKRTVNTALIGGVALALAVMAGCGKSQPSISESSSFQDKAAYALGASMGSYFSKMEKSQAEFLGPLDHALILRGFTDAVNEKLALKEEDVEATLKALDEQIQEKIANKIKEDATRNEEEGRKFLEENGKKEGVVTTDSGLQYKVITPGEGGKAKKGDTVSVTYKGSTLDGKIFDEQKEPVDFPLNDAMIAGWTEGVQLMSPGAEYELYIPAKLAYGENGAGDLIKPNSTLIFNVKLHAVKPAKK